ncbi:hypothetical protein GOBAR_AA25678 [Gossypium barbadense]|uniref:Ion transport domain-containing protein n=1 Tax=Gossypium barbadense TaxID=3634 RepID=A0A2P5WV81_GOSBA|nr:hypothetical protein GOBAR_AA25678 [Gossypium barbadense]
MLASHVETTAFTPSWLTCSSRKRRIKKKKSPFSFQQQSFLLFHLFHFKTTFLFRHYFLPDFADEQIVISKDDFNDLGVIIWLVWVVFLRESSSFCSTTACMRFMTFSRTRFLIEVLPGCERSLSTPFGYMSFLCLLAMVLIVSILNALIVSILNALRDVVSKASYNAKTMLGSILKALAACVTLKTGNSLGPEGPSVEIGFSIAKEIHSLLDKNSHTKLSLLVAGISSSSFLKF